LNLRIDSSSSVPIYAQVVEQVKTLVASRALRAGDRLPSVRDLAAKLRVNRNTAAKAYQMLEMDGVIETRQGYGSYIASGAPLWSRQERKRRFDAALDRFLTEASHLEISFDEILKLMNLRWRRFDGHTRQAAGKR
jgi:GntR family transcriptional regulator